MDIKLKVFQCEKGCYHKLKRDFYSKEKEAIRKPGRHLPLDEEFIKKNPNRIEIITVWDNRCPEDYGDEDPVGADYMWKDVKNEMDFLLKWKRSYEGFTEMSKKIDPKKKAIDRKTLNAHYKLLNQFYEAKYPENEEQTALDFAWRWVCKLENVEIMDEDEIVERIIFKLPLDIRMHMVYRRPENKYALLFLLNDYNPSDDDMMVRKMLEEKHK